MTIEFVSKLSKYIKYYLYIFVCLKSSMYPRKDPRGNPRKDPRRDPRKDPRRDPRKDPRRDTQLFIRIAACLISD